MSVVRLHAVQTPSKVLLPYFARRAPPVFFVVLHGFLAHSGAMNSFVVMLRNALDAHNSAILENNDMSTPVVPFHITTLDARNHGLSPHTPTHVLSSLVDDLDAYLSGQLPQTVQEVATSLDLDDFNYAPAQQQDCDSSEVSTSQKIRVVAIGHSMGSMTWSQYLMNRYVPASLSAVTPSSNSQCGNTVTRNAKKTSPLDVRGFVSMDMPPVTRSNMSVGLVDELVEIIECMKQVDLARIHDLRSAHEEFYRCHMSDIRVRGLCTTNLALTADPSSSPTSKPTHRKASWKCNVPVLEHSIRSGDLFFTNDYFKAPLPSGEAAAAIALREQEVRAYPTVGDVPVLSILGGASPIGGNARYVDLWERYAAKLEQRTIPGASHTVYYDKPHETIDLVKNFLSRIHVL